MLDYETLDAIADLYIPALALIAFALMTNTSFYRDWKSLCSHLALLLSGTLVAYSLMYLDRHFQFWPAFGLDYSTHTAVALALVVFLSVAAKKYRTLWITSLIGYLLLMLYQKYHSMADITTTTIIVGLLLLPIVLLPWHSSRTMATSTPNRTLRDITPK